LADFKRAKAGNQDDLIEKIVFINRVAKVVKGGRRFSFSAIVVVGDGKGMVGYGLGKANQVPEAIRKGVERARKDMQKVSLTDVSIPHEIDGKFKSGKVMLKPASDGTGLIAGGAVRAVLEAAGVHNILTKCLGSNNPHNLVKATIDGLRRLRTANEIARLRGLNVDEMVA
jgi:small subunit ribosomal protein S5